MKFQPGQSGNPTGRPPGSRNKKTLAIEEAFDERAEEILQHLIDGAKNGDKTAQRLCMERMLAPRRERPVVIDLPVIQTPADAREAIAVVTAELSAGGITITEATRLFGLIQRVVRLVGQIAKMEQADRAEEQAQARDRLVGDAVQAVLTSDGESTTSPQPAENGTPADPPLYFPVNSENGDAGGASAAAPPTREQSEGPALAEAA